METVLAIVMWGCGGLATLLLLANFETIYRNLSGKPFRSSITIVPTILMGLAVYAGAPWWALAVTALLDLPPPLIAARFGPKGPPPPPP